MGRWKPVLRNEILEESQMLGKIVEIPHDFILDSLRDKTCKKKEKKEKRKTSNIPSDDADDKKKKRKIPKKLCLDLDNLNTKPENVLAKRQILDGKLIILNEEVRVYDRNRGCFIQCSRMDMYRSIHSSLKEKEKMVVSPATIKATYEIIRMNSDLIIPPEQIDNKKKINLLNGVIDLDSPEELIGHSSKYYFTNCINAEFEMDPEDGVFKSFLNHISAEDKDIKRLLGEWTGYLMSNMTNAKKAAIILGPSDSGKSLFIRLITEIIGSDNCSNIELQKLNDKTYAAQLFNKKVNFCNDLPSQPIKDLGVFKMLTSELDITVSRQLYHDPQSHPCTTKLVFASNHLPNLQPNNGEDLTAFFNRIDILPFLNSVPDDKKDKDLLKKLLKESNAIVKWAIKGACRYVENNYSFSYCSKSQEILSKYRMQYNAHKEFIDNHLVFSEEDYCFLKDLKDSFDEFCKDANIKHSKAHEKTLTEALKLDPRVAFKRLNRDGDNRWGFVGVKFKKKN